MERLGWVWLKKVRAGPGGGGGVEEWGVRGAGRGRDGGVEGSRPVVLSSERFGPVENPMQGLR